MLNLLQLISNTAFASTFLPSPGSALAAKVDSLYMFLLIVSAISCVLVIGGLIYFVIKYRRKSEADKTAYISHNSFLEFLWSFIPFVLFLVIFAWGWAIYKEMRTYPENSVEIQVVGKQWSWDFLYKTGRRINSTEGPLVVPVNKPIKLIMTSNDVIHSFFIPGMRIKQDVIPKRYTALGFTPNVEGEFHIFCTEFCGNDHSKMIGMMKVVSLEEYEKWLVTDLSAGVSLAEQGKAKFGQCAACHSIQGARIVGPPLNGIFGETHEMESGESVVVDEEYIRESIMNPNKKIRKGYPAAMAPLGLDSESITAIIEYLKTLKK